MSEKPQETTENYSSNRFSELLSQLTPNQLRFVVARQDYTTDKDTAEAIGISPDTVYRWNGVVKEAIQLMAEDIVSTAAAIRKRNLAKAMMVKVAALDDPDVNVRQKAATEIIEGEMGRPTQRAQHEHTGADGGAIEVTLSADMLAAASQRAQDYEQGLIGDDSDD